VWKSGKRGRFEAMDGILLGMLAVGNYRL